MLEAKYGPNSSRNDYPILVVFVIITLGLIVVFLNPTTVVDVGILVALGVGRIPANRSKPQNYRLELKYKSFDLFSTDESRHNCSM